MPQRHSCFLKNGSLENREFPLTVVAIGIAAVIVSMINLLCFPAKRTDYFPLKPFFNEIFCHTFIIREFFNKLEVRHVLLLSFSRSSVTN